MRKQKEFSRNSSANKTYRYSELLSIVLDRKTETDQNKKRKYIIVMEILSEVSVLFQHSKYFIDNKL